MVDVLEGSVCERMSTHSTDWKFVFKEKNTKGEIRMSHEAQREKGFGR